MRFISTITFITLFSTSLLAELLKPTPEINPEEVVKRLAAAQGIDVLNLVKSMQEVQQQEQQAMQQEAELEAVKGAPNMMKAPMLDPSKNPELAGEGEAMEQQSPEQPPQE